MSREQCISDLMKNVKSLKCWKDFYCRNNVVRFKDSSDPIPPYIPQVGAQYFEDNGLPRILMYAMNANLNDKKTIKDLTDLRSRFGVKHFYDILNGTSDQNEYCVKGIGPYPHMNMLARLLLYAWKGKVLKFEECVENTATTNLIKCSTTVGASTPNPEMYENCMRNTCLRELQVLRPDILLAMSDDVFYNLSKMLDFTILQTRGKYSIPRHGHKNGTTPKLIISVYHSTGTIAGAFKRLQRYFDDGGNCPKRFRPYIGMLTGEDYHDSPDYWNNAKTEYLKQKDFLLSTYPIFFEEKEWYGLNSNYLFYFTCHLGSFKNIAKRLQIVQNSAKE